MVLKVIGTGSKGNAYLLENEEEALLIECGVNIKAIKQAVSFKLSKIVGCILTHEHGDHAKSIKETMAAGVNVWATIGTHEACGTYDNHRACKFEMPTGFVLGNFKVLPFKIEHDAAEPCGFLINHPETGNVLFLTDTMYSHYTFRNLHNIIIEANYSHEVIRVKLNDMEFLKNRVMQSHMSLDTCIEFLKKNDLSKVNNIVLIHLSDGNSDEVLFRTEVTKATGKTVTVADNGLVMELNKTPF
ncbi:Phosphoribosyl 1,2-cyclic phosphodiesterase [Salinimicrobium sediminis]|uniref:Phosphoribosyl 1,2-cyclic phosphodiesterase n=1 Tax=Salinimicrobium sediminis TaxID=1343891 RepID=A0A285X3I6_9FLAO|nr:MBL fold metallo-hydrolase [Salinimicrobium sediminis]SOC79848.1 Phosphoribosyl 1,2-cyclic phosphodiesterase [Salinimicrobium sediminis]